MQSRKAEASRFCLGFRRNFRQHDLEPGVAIGHGCGHLSVVRVGYLPHDEDSKSQIAVNPVPLERTLRFLWPDPSNRAMRWRSTC